MDRAPGQNRKCEVIPNSRFRFFTAKVNHQGPTGHEEAAVNVAEGLRVECGHELVIVHSTGTLGSDPVRHWPDPPFFQI